MNLSGKKINHKTLGLGVIESLNEGLIIIRFSSGKVSKFRFPDAFTQGFLTAADTELTQYIKNAISARKCDMCGGENLETVIIDGKRLCHKCKVHHSATCSLCGAMYVRSSAQIVSDHEYPHIKTEMCNACAKQNSFRCSKCGHRYFNEYRAPATIWTDECALCKACFDISEFASAGKNSTLSFVMDEGDILYVLLGNDECYKHSSRPALIRLKLRNHEEVAIEGQYCTVCNQVQITRNTCAKYSRYHESMKCELFLKGLDDADEGSTYEEAVYEFRERADESKLMRLGYSVSQSDLRTDVERQAWLENIISTNQVSKGYVIYHLKNLIRINGKKQTNAAALKKWERDLAFVLNL